MLFLQSMQEFHEIATVDEASNLIAKSLEKDGFGAFWLHRDGNCELALFVNSVLAAVYRDSDGTWSHTPGQPEDAYAQFRLENGQVDDFPLSQCVSIEDGVRAFLETAASQTLSSQIAWD